ncbi:MAG: hypothetical protein BWZ09_02720 [Alphaproteobacteria bacterium ADurb.BinA305]|nr:MAG: hypothetical protein BWZ09_02720 [Alphaproteobacteria bacterium ADurb.BinA305]
MTTRALVLFRSLGEFAPTSLMRPPVKCFRVLLLPCARLFSDTRSASTPVARIIGSSFSAAKSFALRSRGNTATCTLGRWWMW